MRVIFTHGITDDTRAFTVRLVRTVVQLDHRIKNYVSEQVSDRLLHPEAHGKQ